MIWCRRPSRAFDLDDVGAEVGEIHCHQRRCQHPREVGDEESRERQRDYDRSSRERLSVSAGSRNSTMFGASGSSDLAVPCKWLGTSMINGMS